jgi:RecA-family ATPase
MADSIKKSIENQQVTIFSRPVKAALNSGVAWANRTPGLAHSGGAVMSTLPHYATLKYVARDIATVVPVLLREIPQWIGWQAGPIQPDGKFEKYPKGRDGTGTMWQKPEQWMTFVEALESAKQQGLSGVGLVLPAKTPEGLQLVALDYDGVDLTGSESARVQEIMRHYENLGSPYVEVSPSGKGIRMFVLSAQPLPQISAPNPLGGKDELFCASSKWVTITGDTPGGAAVPEATEAITALAEQWESRLPAKPSKRNVGHSGSGSARMLGHLTGRWQGWPTQNLRDGDGREEMMLAYAGHLRAKGLDQAIIERMCLEANKEQYEDQLEEDVVLDRARRYADKASPNALGPVETVPVRVEHTAGLAECAPVGDLLKPVSCSDVLTHPEPPPAFIWDGYLPRGVVTLLGAHGGTGKSTIALMLAVCGGLGRPLFDKEVTRTKTVFVSLEDGANVVRYRLGVICRVWGIDPKSLDGWLQVVDGTEYPELFAADRRGEGSMTATYARLSQLVNDFQAGLVIVDNASDAYGGDEIQRRQVRAFMRALAQIARLTDGSVLLLAHVDKTTSRNRKADGGEGYSGSTAWHNSARSRLFLTRGDDGVLILEHQKSNFGRMQEPITLRWEANQLPQLLDLDAVFDDLRNKSFIETQTAVAVLRLIADFESRGQYCSPAVTSRNTVFAVLKSEPAFLKLKLRSDDTRRLLNQCQRADWIEIVDYKSPDRKPRQRWGLTAQGREQLKAVAPTAPSTAVEGNWHMAQSGAPSAPTYAGGVGGSARACLPEEEAQEAVHSAAALTTDA